MAQLEDRLSALLNDDEGRQNLLKIASMLGGNKSADEPSDTAKQNIDPPSSPQQDASESGNFASFGNDRTGALFAMLPQLLQALSGNGDILDGKRVNLIRAISPYLSPERGDYIDRAIKMASVAKAAKDTLGAFTANG